MDLVRYDQACLNWVKSREEPLHICSIWMCWKCCKITNSGISNLEEMFLFCYTAFSKWNDILFPSIRSQPFKWHTCSINRTSANKMTYLFCQSYLSQWNDILVLSIVPQPVKWHTCSVNPASANEMTYLFYQSYLSQWNDILVLSIRSQGEINRSFSPILGQCSLSIPHEKARKPLVFWRFQGV